MGRALGVPNLRHRREREVERRTDDVLFYVDHPERSLDRMTTFFKIFTAFTSWSSWVKCRAESWRGPQRTAQRGKSRNDIIFLFDDGEELGTIEVLGTV
jgi:hypothetical protein